MPAKSLRAALCCAGAEPAACDTAELEYGNPLDHRLSWPGLVASTYGTRSAEPPLQSAVEFNDD
eukprot:6183608-Pleurochrysis_carterae.AAC.1